MISTRFHAFNVFIQAWAGVNFAASPRGLWKGYADNTTTLVVAQNTDGILLYSLNRLLQCLTRLSILLINMEKVAFRRWRSDSHLLSSFSIASFTCIQRQLLQ